MSDTPPEDAAPGEATEPDAGVPEGTVLETPEGPERVVYDYDDSGTQIGWHKEPAGG